MNSTKNKGIYYNNFRIWNKTYDKIDENRWNFFKKNLKNAT